MFGDFPAAKVERGHERPRMGACTAWGTRHTEAAHTINNCHVADGSTRVIGSTNTDRTTLHKSIAYRRVHEVEAFNSANDIVGSCAQGGSWGWLLLVPKMQVASFRFHVIRKVFRQVAIMLRTQGPYDLYWTTVHRRSIQERHPAN